jgi:type III restriction enzyme
MRLGMEYGESFAEIINIVLSEENIQHFVNVLDAAKEKYAAETTKRDAGLARHVWDVPETMNFGGDFTPFEAAKSVIQPFYYDNRWKTEKAFIAFLEKSGRVRWWFKNGDRDSTFFAVPYVEDGEERPFYVDFVVLHADGSVGLYDTKSGRTIKDSKEKSDGLQAHIAELKKKSAKTSGGIVANTDPAGFTGRWMVYTGKGSDLSSADFSDWTLLDL